MRIASFAYLALLVAPFAPLRGQGLDLFIVNIPVAARQVSVLVDGNTLQTEIPVRHSVVDVTSLRVLVPLPGPGAYRVRVAASDSHSAVLSSGKLVSVTAISTGVNLTATVVLSEVRVGLNADTGANARTAIPVTVQLSDPGDLIPADASGLLLYRTTAEPPQGEPEWVGSATASALRMSDGQYRYLADVPVPLDTTELYIAFAACASRQCDISIMGTLVRVPVASTSGILLTVQRIPENATTLLIDLERAGVLERELQVTVGTAARSKVVSLSATPGSTYNIRVAATTESRNGTRELLSSGKSTVIPVRSDRPSTTTLTLTAVDITTDPVPQTARGDDVLAIRGELRDAGQMLGETPAVVVAVRDTSFSALPSLPLSDAGSVTATPKEYGFYAFSANVTIPSTAATAYLAVCAYHPKRPTLRACSLLSPITVSGAQPPIVDDDTDDFDTAAQSLLFQYSLGTVAPPSQIITVSGVGSGTPFSTEVPAGNEWVHVSATEGRTPTEISVSANPAHLNPGYYATTITIRFVGDRPLRVSVSLVVTEQPPLVGRSNLVTIQYTRGESARPPSQRVSLSDAIQRGMIASNTPWLSGQLLTSTTVVLTVRPDRMEPGQYIGTLYCIDLTALGKVQTIIVFLSVEAGRPRISRIVNAASNLAAEPLSPGEVVTILGSELGPAQFSSAVPGRDVGTTLNGVQVHFNGKPAPLLSVQRECIRAVVPYGVSGVSGAWIKVDYQGKVSDYFVAGLAPAHPGVFTQDGSGIGQAAALNEDSTANSASNAARAGSVISLFITGSGSLEPAAVDGRLASSAATRCVLPIKVVIGSEDVEVLYAGPAIGLVSGVTQINARVPRTVSSPQAPVYVRVGGVQTQAAVFISVTATQ